MERRQEVPLEVPRWPYHKKTFKGGNISLASNPPTAAAIPSHSEGRAAKTGGASRRPATSSATSLCRGRWSSEGAVRMNGLITPEGTFEATPLQPRLEHRGAVNPNPNRTVTHC